MNAFDLIKQELDRQKALPNAADIAAQEAKNTLNDRVATALAYLGRVPKTVFRNTREGCDPTENLVKAAAVLVTAIEATRSASEAAAELPGQGET